MSKKILVIGAGAHSKVVVDIIISQGQYEIIGLIDNYFPIGHKVLNFSVLGKEEDLPSLYKKHSIYGGVVAIGDNYSRYLTSNTIENNLNDFNFINCIHPSSNIASNVALGSGNVIMAGATIGVSSSISNHCIINTNSSIDHDCMISSFVSIAPNAATGGNVKIDKFSALSIGATISHKISVKKNCIVGANSFVNKDTESNSIYYGAPARFIRKHQLGDKYL